MTTDYGTMARGAKSLEAEVRDQRSEIRSQRSEVRSQKSEVSRLRARPWRAREDGGQRETWIALSSAEVILSG